MEEAVINVGQDHVAGWHLSYRIFQYFIYRMSKRQCDSTRKTKTKTEHHPKMAKGTPNPFLGTGLACFGMYE